MFRPLLALAACALPAPLLADAQPPRLDLAAPAAPLPPPLQALVDDAFTSATEAELDTILKYVRRAAPEQAAVLDARLEQRRAAQRAAAQTRLASGGALDNWSGQAELGASRSTGNVDAVGLVGGFNATREGVRWRHLVRATAEVQETNGVRTQERLLLAYEPRYKVSDQLSAYGLVQAERVPLLGYAARYSASAGLGYALVQGDGLSVNVQGGPAFRHAKLIGGGHEQGLSGRAALDARLRLSSGLSLTNTASAFLDSRGNSLSSSTGLEARLIGPLGARLSYNVQYESEPANGRTGTDTQSRLTFVYGF